MKKAIQLGIFDISRPKTPLQKQKSINDPELTNFITDINSKKTYAKLGEWRLKHQNRIRKLPKNKQEIIDKYYQQRRENFRLPPNYV